MNTIPNIEFKEDIIEGKVELKVWENFNSCRYRSGISYKHDQKPPDPWVRMTIGSYVHDKKPELIPEQIAAYEFLVKEQDALKKMVLNAILADYPAWQKDFNHDPEDKVIYMPDINDIEEFKPVLEIGTITILSEHLDGVSYIGFGFGCSWDGEHGVGVMTHKNRVIEVGGGDCSFLEWIAVRDRDKLTG